MAEAFTIAGRSFVHAAESTLEQDLRILALTHACGLEAPTMGPEEGYETFAKRLFQEVAASGKTLELLGCLVVPDGTPPSGWTLAMGEDTARFFGSLSLPEDKAQVQGLILEMIIRFFERGLSSLHRFQASGAKPEEAAEQAGKIFTSATGEPSSAS